MSAKKGVFMIDLFAACGSLFDEVHYVDFYRDLFPEGSFERKGILDDCKPNGIAISIAAGEKKAKRYTITDDLEIIDDIVSTDDFCLMSPISYIGKSRKSENARFMYAMAIDLDGIENIKQWGILMEQIERGEELNCFVWGLPCPTYIICSGTGLHLYYVFEKPIPLFKNVVKELEKIKKRITWQAWTQGASSLHDNVQYESLFQGFRMVGSITKKGDRCRAFKVGNKVTLEYLNKFVPEEYRVESIVYKSNLTLAEAKKKYPEWYKKRIVEGSPKETWVCKKDLYNWWIKKLKAGAEQGHRYWCIMTLATYAKKCNVSYEELERDSYNLIPYLNSIGDEPFTEDDVIKALEAYNDSYITYPIDTIVNRTGIPIEKNKRNYRKQDVHLERARAVQMIDYPNREWINKDGAPTKKDIVQEWRKNNPNGTKYQCTKETGMSKNTVKKWW